MKKCKQSGFTLLEVMIAMTIMVIAFSAILKAQSGSIHQTIKTKELNIAGFLAQQLMVESEHLYEGVPFSEVPKEEGPEAFSAPFEKYSWKREVLEVKFPDISAPEKEGESVPESMRIFKKVINKYLSDSLREMVITVTWKRGKGEQKISVTTYLLDLDTKFDFSI